MNRVAASLHVLFWRHAKIELLQETEKALEGWLAETGHAEQGLAMRLHPPMVLRIEDSAWGPFIAWKSAPPRSESGTESTCGTTGKENGDDE